MNSKHLACLLLFAVVIALSQGTLMLHKGLVTAQQATKDAEDRHELAQMKHKSTSDMLEGARVKTAAHRKFLEMWRQDFEKTGSDVVAAKNEFGRMLKRFPNLIPFTNQTLPPVENKDMAYINRRVTSSVKLEGPAEKAVQLLAAVEREMPTSRIQSLEIRKGQRGNDVELDLSVDSPLLPAPPVVK